MQCSDVLSPWAKVSRRWLYGFAWLLVLTCGCAEQEPPSSAALADLALAATYQPQAKPKGLALVLSDNAGWTPAREALGKKLAARGYLVGGVDSRPYLNRLRRDGRPCVSLADDLKRLARRVQSQHGPTAHTETSHPPIWLGIGEGAAMVYAAAVQAPTEQVHAVVSLNFCPQLITPDHLCAADGVDVKAKHESRALGLSPTPRLATPWFIFQERDYPGCPLTSVRRFADQIQGARLVEWPSDHQPTGDGPDLEAQVTALMQWLDPRLPRQARSVATLSGLPLIESRAPSDHRDDFAVFLSGDGGWAAFDKGMAASLASRGVSTVGWDSLAYYWKPRTPGAAASDLARLVRYYLANWQKQRVLLIGYSFGADVLPFLVNRLPADIRSRVDGVALLGLAKTTAFEFHLAEWLGIAPAQAYPIAPEIARLRAEPILCVYGTNETDSLCPSLHAPTYVSKVPGNHHFNGAFDLLSSHILDLVRAFGAKTTR
jgi:type IV secretory pathway VirJ component